jgi:hypothetical protein
VAEEEPAEEPPAAETIPDPARAPEPRSAAAVAGNWSGDFEGKAFSLELSAPVPSSDGRWSLTGHGSVELSSGARRFPVNGNFERDSISLRGEAFLFKGRLDPKDLSSMSGVAMTTTGQPRPWRLVRR